MPALDAMSSYTASTIGSPEHAAAVTPNDAQDLAYVTRSIWVGTQGDLKVTMQGGETLTYPAAIGQMSLRVSRIHAAGTTASGIVAMW